MTDRVAPDWDTAALAEPRVVEADPTGRGGPLAVGAAAALDARAGGDEATVADAVGELALAGVVALRRRGGPSYEVRETLGGWELVASSVPTPDPPDLGAAALVRARRLAAARRAGGAGR